MTTRNNIIGMGKYRVTIGEEIFDVTTVDNLSARYEAAELFRQRFNLNVPLGKIVEYSRARVVTAPFEPTQTTEEVLKLLGKSP